MPPKAVIWVGWTENRSFHRGVQNERYGSFWISAPFKCHFQRKVSSVPFFYLHFCVTHRSNMQKWSTQILYQYLGTKVCLHSYNDTVNANAEVIIESYLSGCSSLRNISWIWPSFSPLVTFYHFCGSTFYFLYSTHSLFHRIIVPSSPHTCSFIAA